MRRSRKAQRRIVASILTGVFLMQQTMTLSVFASTITSVGSGVSQNGNTFTIDPMQTNGNIGFQRYDKFDLSKGDTANLNFNDVDTFVNLLNNGSFNINGTLNSIRNNNFYDGKAIFISPNGMVVGSSGVLNVGSLGVYTHSADQYDTIMQQSDISRWTDRDVGLTSNGTITIDGKVFSSGDIALRAGQINLGQTGALIGGLNTTVGQR